MTGKTTSQSTDMALNNCFGAHVYNKTVTEVEVSLHEIFTEHDLISNLQDKINYKFNNLDHLIMALTHRSFIHEYVKQKRSSYERLEFLGDSILGSFVTYRLYHKFPHSAEGKLSKLRSALVNENTLAQISQFIEADKCILLGKGELQNKLTNSIISDVFEALIGAITLDSSIEKAYEVLAYIISEFEKSTEQEFFSEKKLYLFDPKTTLQELIMKEYKSLPVYKSSSVDGGFKVQLIINDEKVDELTGLSKKQVQKDLALKYLNTILK